MLSNSVAFGGGKNTKTFHHAHRSVESSLQIKENENTNLENILFKNLNFKAIHNQFLLKNKLIYIQSVSFSRKKDWNILDLVGVTLLDFHK